MIEVEIDKSVYLPCFHHLLPQQDENGNYIDDDIDIEIIWGGRDSGKSKFVAQLFTELSMHLDYFRCLLIKETHESIKDAQWQMIKDIAEDDWGVDSLFNFQTSPLGIKVANGNTFLTRGMDKPGKIRSVANPSHAWGEEFNQVSEAGFITLLTGLRSDKGRVKLYLTLNPEAKSANYEDFWFFKMFFKKHYPNTLSFTDHIEVTAIVKGEKQTIRLKYRSTHVTYHDNPYITPQRIAFHETLQETNPYWHQVFTKGLWGNQENESPWAFAFNRKKHVGKAELNRAFEVYASFDFNRNPMTCSIIQHYDHHVRVLETIKIPKSGVETMCEYIKVNYPGCLWIVTGDYSGTTASPIFQEQISNYTVIQTMLGLSDAQIQVQPNPRLQTNQTLVNLILSKYKVTIDEEKAKGLIFDMENVKKRADGTIVKDDRNDPAQQSDALDTFRYFCNKFLAWFTGV